MKIEQEINNQYRIIRKMYNDTDSFDWNDLKTAIEALVDMERLKLDPYYFDRKLNFHGMPITDQMKSIAWRYCNKCGKVLELNYYPFNRAISKELDIIEEEHQLHLCKTCSNEFPTCDVKKIVFGDCVGNDNVIECDGFIQK